MVNNCNYLDCLRTDLYSKGYCKPHYNKLSRISQDKRCTVDGCNILVQAKGLCAAHYKRLRKTGTTDLIPVEERFCSIDRCDTPHYGKGYCKKHYSVYRKHGKRISVEEYDNILKTQNDSCEICHRNDVRLCIDHDHQTDKFRGILCMNCNALLGQALDNIDTLASAIEYLKKSQSS